MLRFIICEDNKEFLNKLCNIVNKVMMPYNYEYKISKFTEYNKEVEEIIKRKNEQKVYILDIELPEVSGLEIASEIREDDLDSIIIFITAHNECKNDVFYSRLLAIDYIAKDRFWADRFEKTITHTVKAINKNRVLSFLLTIWTIYLLRDYIAARAQLVTFILFVLTVYFIEQFLATKKKRYIFGLIIIPILIANIHTAVFLFYFVLYLPYVGEYIIHLLSNTKLYMNNYKIKKLKKKLKEISNEEEIEKINQKTNELEEKNRLFVERQNKRDEKAYKIKITRNDNAKYLIIIMIVCILAGFLTPLGTTPYTYLVKTMQGNTTKNIAEHLPLTLITNVNYMVVLVVFLGILIFTDTKIRLCDLFMLGGLTFLTFYTKR